MLGILTREYSFGIRKIPVQKAARLIENPDDVPRFCRQ